MKKSQIYKALITEYDRKRTFSRLELESRKNDVYRKLPRIKEIDDEIARLGMASAAAALSLPDNAEELAASFEASCTGLIAEKESILKEHRIPKKYMEIYYDCKICGDTGFVDKKECKCFTSKRIEMAYNLYSLKEKLKSENFDNFDFRYYSGSLYKDYPVSPKENIEKIYAFCLKYTKNFGNKSGNLMIYGKPGLGKTFLCNCISKELMDNGFIVMYLTAFQLSKILETAQFDRKEQEDYVIDDLLSADLLIIDDIGTEFSTSLTNSGFFNIINYRANAKKPVVISTNLYPHEIKAEYSERIFSRISNNYSAIELYGDDVGWLKKCGKFLS